MPEAREQTEIELGIRDYLLILYKRRWIILGVFLLVFFVTIHRVNLQVPIYRATASVRIIERKTVATLLTDWITTTPGDPLASQAEVIVSFPVVERAVRKLGYVSKDATSEEAGGVVASVQGMLSATPLKYTNIIEITAEGTERGKVALIANAVAESYVEENLREKAKQARTVKEFIETQLKEVSSKLRVSEKAVEEFRRSGKVTGIAGSLQNKLADLEIEKAKLLRIYTESYPNVIEINKEINMLKEQIKLMPDLEFEFTRLSREIEMNEGSYRVLQEKLADARIAEAEKVADVTLVNLASIPGGSVRPNKTSSMIFGTLVGLVLGVVVGFTVEQLDTSIGTIEDVERYLTLPVLGVIPFLRTEKPKEKMLLFKKRFLSRSQKRDLTIQNLKKQLLIYYSSQSPVIEAYRILRTNIIIEVLKNQTKGKTILISSAGPEEGKSINVANLGICLAQTGLKVLIMDTDLRRSSIHKIFGFSEHHQLGLTDILRQAAKLEDVLRSITDLLVENVEFEKILLTPGIDNLNFLFSGSPAAIPTELLGSQDMASLLEKLKEKFDIIILDTPPILAVADAMLLAPKVDAVLLIYKVGKTARTAIMRAKKQLEAVGATAKGIILNNISPEVEMRSQYYYYRYRYYSSKKEEK